MNIELMSPAGNIFSFFKALENGADSIYLGLKKYNARKPADNFTVYQLKKIVKIAHQNKKKIYLTLNIDLKCNEIEEAFSILQLAANLKIDAVIIKDPALIYLANKFLNNKINLHLSTQTAISSSFGIKTAKLMNIKRVVLARELTLEEIKSASAIKNIETEVFCEGSMCFSISGRCLMSSWVGGRSGNRGVCTAPCRVLWEREKNKNTYFSMKDLSLINYISELKETGTYSIKIEGRLKNPDWVGKVTNIYRNAIDKTMNPEEINKHYDKLNRYSARERDTGHTTKHNELIGKNENWENYEKYNGEKNSNKLDKYNEKNLIIINENDDKLSIEILLYEIKKNFEIKISQKKQKAKLIPIKNIENNIKEQNLTFKINSSKSFSSTNLQKIINEIKNNINQIIKEAEKLPLPDEIIKNDLKTIETNQTRKLTLGNYPDKIIIKSDDIEKFIDNRIQIDTIVVQINTNIKPDLIDELKRTYKITLSIPAVLYEEEAQNINNTVKNLFKNGFKNFEANSFTGIEILNELNCNKTLGIDIPVMNHIAARFYYNKGFSSLYTSFESDMSTYKACSKFTEGKIESLVFGKIPLFTSRVDSEEFTNRTIFKDKFGIEIECHKLSGINYFASKKIFSLVDDKIKKENIQFDHLTADLRFFKDPFNIISLILKNDYKISSSTFNFYKKLI